MRVRAIKLFNDLCHLEWQIFTGFVCLYMWWQMYTSTWDVFYKNDKLDCKTEKLKQNLENITEQSRLPKMEVLEGFVARTTST